MMLEGFGLQSHRQYFQQTVGLEFIGNHIEAYVPEYATDGSSGLDLRADIAEPLEILPGKHYVIDTGIKFEIPSGLEGQVRSRSGLAYKYGASITHGVGTIDSDYTGEIKVFLKTTEPFTVNPGDRIAQIVFAQYERVTVVKKDSIAENQSRGSNGFGSTGMK